MFKLLAKQLTHRALLTALCCLMSSTGIAWAENTPSLKTLVEKAKEARERGDLDGALNALRAAYALDPQPVLLNNLGKLHEQRGEYDLAFELYTKVTNDPKASTELRMLDQSRIAALEPKLSKAWARVGQAGRWADIHVDGVYCPAEGGAEIAVTPGQRQVELFDANRKEARLFTIKLQAGRRITIDADQLVSQSEAATLLVLGLTPLPVSIVVDAYTLNSPVARLERVLVSPGQHITRLMTPNGKWTDVQTSTPAGGVTLLAQAAGNTWSNLNKNIPAVAGNTSRVGEGPKLLTAGLGATLVGSGLFLYFDVEQGRSYLLDEGQSPNLTVRDAADRWESLNTRATVGGVLTGLGSAVVVGSALWWWFDGSKMSATARLIPMPWCEDERCGLGLGGEL